MLSLFPLQMQRIHLASDNEMIWFWCLKTLDSVQSSFVGLSFDMRQAQPANYKTIIPSLSIWCVKGVKDVPEVFPSCFVYKAFYRKLQAAGRIEIYHSDRIEERNLNFTELTSTVTHPSIPVGPTQETNSHGFCFVLLYWWFANQGRLIATFLPVSHSPYQYNMIHVGTFGFSLHGSSEMSSCLLMFFLLLLFWLLRGLNGIPVGYFSKCWWVTKNMFLPVQGGGPKVPISPCWVYGVTKMVIYFSGRYQLQADIDFTIVLYNVLSFKTNHQTANKDKARHFICIENLKTRQFKALYKT